MYVCIYVSTSFSLSLSFSLTSSLPLYFGGADRIHRDRWTDRHIENTLGTHWEHIRNTETDGQTDRWVDGKLHKHTSVTERFKALELHTKGRPLATH